MVGKTIEVGYLDDDSEDSETTWWEVEVIKFNGRTKIHTLRGEEDGEEFTSEDDLRDTFWRYPAD